MRRGPATACKRGGQGSATLSVAQFGVFQNRFVPEAYMSGWLLSMRVAPLEQEPRLASQGPAGGMAAMGPMAGMGVGLPGPPGQSMPGPPPPPPPMGCMGDIGAWAHHAICRSFRRGVLCLCRAAPCFPGMGMNDIGMGPGAMPMGKAKWIRKTSICMMPSERDFSHGRGRHGKGAKAPAMQTNPRGSES